MDQNFVVSVGRWPDAYLINMIEVPVMSKGSLSCPCSVSPLQWIILSTRKVSFGCSSQCYHITLNHSKSQLWVPFWVCFGCSLAPAGPQWLPLHICLSFYSKQVLYLFIEPTNGYWIGLVDKKLTSFLEACTIFFNFLTKTSMGGKNLCEVKLIKKCNFLE